MKRVNGPKWRGQTAKAQSLASKPPILTEAFGWMWSARDLLFLSLCNQGFTMTLIASRSFIAR
jgi:hypothetical protein